MQTGRLIVLVMVILAAAAMRLFPHPPNVSPMTAMAIFGGAYFTDKRLAFLVPLGAMFLSDFFLGFHRLLPLVYGCFMVNVMLGVWVNQRRSVLTVVSASFTGSILFFVITNFGVWAFESLYPRTLDGLTTCFAAAVPFFRNALFGDLGYTLILFGGFSAAEKFFPALRTSTAS